MCSGKAGHSLLEMIVAIWILMIFAGLALPRGWDLVEEYRLRGAAHYFRGLLRQVRSQAAAKGRYTGIVFDEAMTLAARPPSIVPMLQVPGPRTGSTGHSMRRRDSRLSSNLSIAESPNSA